MLNSNTFASSFYSFFPTSSNLNSLNLFFSFDWHSKPPTMPEAACYENGFSTLSNVILLSLTNLPLSIENTHAFPFPQ